MHQFRNHWQRLMSFLVLYFCNAVQCIMKLMFQCLNFCRGSKNTWLSGHFAYYEGMAATSRESKNTSYIQRAVQRRIRLLSVSKPQGSCYRGKVDGTGAFRVWCLCSVVQRDKIGLSGDSFFLWSYYFLSVPNL